MMNLIEEACDGNWTVAYTLIREQEEFEFLRDAEARKRLHDMHGAHLQQLDSSHAKLIAIKQRRLAKSVSASSSESMKCTRPRMRGKGYARYVRPLLVVKGKTRLEQEKIYKESNRQKQLLFETEATRKRAAELTVAEASDLSDDGSDDDSSSSSSNFGETKRDEAETESKMLANLAIGEEVKNILTESQYDCDKKSILYSFVYDNKMVWGRKKL